MKKLNKKSLQFFSLEEIIKKASRSKTFEKVYNDELVVLKLASQIRQIRNSKKLTQKSLAEKTKMSQSAIARIESGEHGFSVDTLHRVARAFNKKVQLV